MFKFLRKYNKLILAVGGVLLMITFLIPQAIQQLSQSAGRRGATIATVDNGTNVTTSEWQQAQEEMHFLEQQGGARIRGLGRIQKTEHWYLLVREAEKAGLIGKVNIPDEQLQMMVRMSDRRNPELIRNVVAHLNGIDLLINLFENSAAFSDRRLQTFAERMMHMVNAEMVVIEADAAKSDFNPTEAEMVKQMETYADKLPGEGEMGFGYKLPDRAKLEWIAVTDESIRNLVRNSEAFNGVAQRMHWRKHAPKAGETPDPAKPNAKNFPAVDDSGQVPQVVKDDLLNELTAQKFDEISKYAIGQIQRNRLGVPEKDGFAVLPDDWNSRKIDFTQLATEIQKQFPGLELPAYVAPGGWLSWEDVNALPGIGTSLTDKFGRPLGMGALFKAVKEFGGDGNPSIQKNVAGPAMKGMDGSLYLFRFNDTDPTRKPTSLDEVRGAVVKDLRRLSEFHHLEAQTAEIEKQARTDGLLSVAQANGTVVQRPSNVTLCMPGFAINQVTNGQPVLARPFELPVVGENRKATEAIIDRALALPKDQPLSSLPADQTVFVVPMQDKLSMMVVRLKDQKPLTEDLFTQLVNTGAVQSLMVSETTPGYGQMTKPGQAPTDPVQTAFSLEALAKRHNFAMREGESHSSRQKPDAPFDNG